jgi:RHS repeat-associated protein
MVLDPSTDEVDLRNSTGWEEIPYSGGVARVELRALHRGTTEYYALMNRRSEHLNLVKATHYTSFGNEIREDFQVEPGTKTLVNLPQGLGRYEEDGTRLYYLKNHLENTVLAATSSSEDFKSAYDYFPYGRLKVVQTLVADKITETFTGKELDEETGFGGLYYFGARYYDPVIGVWITPDAARQFASPYAYSPNPLNSIDPDGNQVRPVRTIPATAPTFGYGNFFIPRGMPRYGGLGEALIRYQASPVRTPHETVRQSSATPSFLEMYLNISAPPRLFKGGQLGRSEATGSQYLSFENPLRKGFAQRHGVPEKNTPFNFIMEVSARDATQVVTRPAIPMGANRGGATEAVSPSENTRIESFIMPD